MNEVKSIHEAWLLMNRVYWHLRQVNSPLEARNIVNGLAGQLFEEMFKEAA